MCGWAKAGCAAASPSNSANENSVLLKRMFLEPVHEVIDQGAYLAGEMPPVRVNGLEACPLRHVVVEHPHQFPRLDHRIGEVAGKQGNPKAGQRRVASGKRRV